MHGRAVEEGNSRACLLQNSASGSSSAPKRPTPCPDSRMGGAPVKVLEIIAAARAAGVTLSIDDDSLLLRSSRPPPQEVVEALSRHKSEVIDHLQSDRSGWTAEDWHVFFDERAAIAEFDGGLPRRRPRPALSRAASSNGSTATRALAARSLPSRCGGEPTGPRPLLPFGIERTGHAWLHSRCWRPWHASKPRLMRSPSPGDRDRGSDRVAKRFRKKRSRMMGGFGSGRRSGSGRDTVEMPAARST